MGLLKTETLPLLLMTPGIAAPPFVSPAAAPEDEPKLQVRRQPAAPMLVGVDLGGTHTRAAVVRDNADIVARVRVPTPAAEGPAAVISTIAATVREALEMAEIGIADVRGIGISAPGPLNPRTGVVYQAPNLHDWFDVPLGEEVARIFPVPVFVGHDATLAGYAEYRFGAGQGANEMIYMTVSTGIGGGLITQGLIVDGVIGTAGEIGHMYLDMRPDAPVCGAGHHGCLEALASGTALARDASALVAAGRGLGIVAAHQARLAELEADAHEEQQHMAARDVVTAAQVGDPEALELIHAAGVAIGYGIVNLIHILNPQRIVIGGGVSNAGELLFAPIHATIRERAFARPAQDLEIVPAQLADDGGLIGSATYVDYQLMHQGHLHL